MTNKSSTDHYDAAEKLLKEAESHREPDTRAEWCLELARMHLALSQASIAAWALDLRQKASAGPNSHTDTPSSPSATLDPPGFRGSPALWEGNRKSLTPRRINSLGIGPGLHNMPMPEAFAFSHMPEAPGCCSRYSLTST